MADPTLLRENRGRLRLSAHIAGQLEAAATNCLAQAKAMHDELEQLYNPHVDFGRCDRIAEEIIAQIGL